jgi:large subunit ribosomal protein L21
LTRRTGTGKIVFFGRAYEEGQKVYAVIRSGGKQYRVEPGATVRVERLESPVGEKVTFDEVLLVGDGERLLVGNPRVASASVVGVVVDQGRARKLRVFKFKKRKHYRRTRGHRQYSTALRIETIDV